MDRKQVFALLIAVLLIAALTGAAMGAMSWWLFWIVAALSGIYAWYVNR